MKKLLVVVSLLALLVLSCQPARKIGDGNVGVTFDGSTNLQRIDFGNVPALSPNQLTIAVWLKQNSLGTSFKRVVTQYNMAGSTPPERSWAFIVNYLSAGVIAFANQDSTGNGGIWTSGTLATGAPHQVVITYDWSSVLNDPVMYIDGSSVVVTEAQAPSTGYPSATTDLVMTLGDVPYGPDGAAPVDGTVLAALLYNRIWTAAEVSSAYTSRLLIPTYQGLIFAPRLSGASGLQSFDGTTLGSTNLIQDTFSGATGTPAGSPVGAGESYLVLR